MPGEFRKRELVDDVFVVTYIVDDSHKGSRADQYLKSHYRRKSRNQLQKAIDEGRITLTGKRLKASTILRPGDEIKVFTPRITEEPHVDLNYKVLYEDDYLLAIDKPGNLPVHPAGRFLFNTLIMALKKERADWIGDGRDFYLIHRLDRETSGVIIIAKQKSTAAALIKQFYDRKTEKRYFAITQGHCSEKEFSVDADIGPASGSEIRLKMGTYPKGTSLINPESGIMEALTHFKVLKSGKNVDLLDCDLKTGRQHQIRVHLAHKGHPVVGDKLYGGHESLFLKYIEDGVITEEMKQVLGFERHALHSRYLKFYHDRLGKWIEVESPLPQDMEKLFKSPER